MSRDSIFLGSLEADYVRMALFQAYTHAADERDPAWERHALKEALSRFEKLSALIPAIRARLSILDGVPVCANHSDRPSRTNLDGDELCQECADAWVRAEGQAVLDADSRAALIKASTPSPSDRGTGDHEFAAADEHHAPATDGMSGGSV